MQLTLHADYAFRVLLYLGSQPEGHVASTREISEAYGISRHHLIRVAQTLARHGFVTISGGRVGGLSLAGDPQTIRLGDVIRKAETKSLSTISAEMKDFAARARARKLKPEEYQGGTTAVSNLGMFGVKDFAAVINPPHATILAVGAGEARPVVRGGEVKIATVMSVTLSTDHRAVDGALGAELLSAFRRRIENPMGMLV